MRLFLLENESSIERLPSTNYQPGVDAIVSFNYLVFNRLRREGGHRHVFCEELLNRHDYEALHEATDRVAQEWFLRDGRDKTVFDGISYGSLVKGMFARSYMLTLLVKYGEIIRKAASFYPECSGLVTDFSLNGISLYALQDDEAGLFDKRRLAEDIARQLGFSCHWLEPPRGLAVACTGRRFPGDRHGTLFKIAAVIELLLNGLGWAARLARKERPRTYLFPYRNINSIIGDLSGSFVLSRLSRGSISFKALFSGVYFADFKRIPYALTAAELEFVAALKAELGHHAPGFEFNGIDYSAFYVPVIGDIIRTAIPLLLRRIGQFRLGLRSHRIGTVILNSTVEEEMMALLAACAREGVRSVFVDHGLVGHRAAQKAACSSPPHLVVTPGQYDPYGYESPRVALGNPSMDPYPKHRRKKVKSLRRVLFLSFEDNYYARLDRSSYQEKYYEEIFSVFPELSRLGIEVCYKPHPSESKDYHQALFRFFGVNGGKVRYLGGRNFSRIVREMDLVVSNVSSCFYEALAAGVPAIFLEPVFIPEALCLPLSGEHGREVLRVSTGKELIELIRACHKDAAPLNRFVERFLDEYAPRYMGRLDGRAGRKIVDFAVGRHEAP